MSDDSARVLRVAELNRLARLAVERALPIGWVTGEISNLTRAPSGHWYFTLKDAEASVRCAMFRNRNQFLDWRPENGMEVEVRAQATLYEPRGDFQLNVEAMRRAGLGALYEAFARLKARLEAEGLFDVARKRPLPPWPKVIGLITSPQAAALRDVLTTLRRRWPAATVILYPSPVQGEAAPAGLIAALRQAAARRECDVLLLVRGGGSLEDLWAFNDEALARAIAACPIPVVSGIGHETDFTIADFVADLRAPTPTAAAERITPDRIEVGQHLRHLFARFCRAQERRLQTASQRLDGLTRRLRHPAERIATQRRHLAQWRRRLDLAVREAIRRARLCQAGLSHRLRATSPTPALLRQRLRQERSRLQHAFERRIERQRARLNALSDALSHLNPQAVLDRGFSLVCDSQGRIVRDAAALIPGASLRVRFARGEIDACVTGVRAGG